MTTTTTLPITLPVLTPRGNRIPLVGTIAFHDALGFCTVISRTQTALRITIDDIDGADDVTVRDGSSGLIRISRADWMSSVSDASLTSACIEIAGLEARRDGLCPETGLDAPDEHQDPFIGARTFIKSMVASIEGRVRGADEMIVSIDAAERCGWEFDEYATFTPLKNIKKAKAPKPVVVAPPVEEVDDAMPSWMADEMGECFNDDAVWNGGSLA